MPLFRKAGGRLRSATRPHSGRGAVALTLRREAQPGGHQQRSSRFRLCSGQQVLKLRYICRMFAKELLLKNFVGIPQDQLLKRLAGADVVYRRELAVGLAFKPRSCCRPCLTHTYLVGYISINSRQVIDPKCRTLTMCSSERSPIRLGGLCSNDCAAKESRRSGP
jgi:hypothetical protein